MDDGAVEVRCVVSKDTMNAMVEDGHGPRDEDVDE